MKSMMHRHRPASAAKLTGAPGLDGWTICKKTWGAPVVMIEFTIE
jgi:hypothetical protein